MMGGDERICRACVEKTTNLERQLERLQEELRYCRRLCYKEQHRNEQLKAEIRALAPSRNKFQEYELTSIKMGKVS